MHDLKAAAAWHRDMHNEAVFRRNSLSPNAKEEVCAHYEDRIKYHTLAAQALETWAWQAENGADVIFDCEDNTFVCETFDAQFRHDEPMFSVWQAMKGDEDNE